MKRQRISVLVDKEPRGTKKALADLMGVSHVTTNARLKKGIKTLRKQVEFQQAYNTLFETDYSRNYLFEEIDYEPNNG